MQFFFNLDHCEYSLNLHNRWIQPKLSEKHIDFFKSIISNAKLWTYKPITWTFSLRMIISVFRHSVSAALKKPLTCPYLKREKDKISLKSNHYCPRGIFCYHGESSPNKRILYEKWFILPLVDYLSTPKFQVLNVFLN